MLTGSEILKRHKRGEIEITDFNLSRLNPNSYNLRLGNKFLFFENPDSIVIDSKVKPKMKEVTASEKEGIILYPRRLYLASTMETTWAKDLIPCISGRSSFARLGVQIHQTAGFGDIGVRLKWTLEITVVHPTRLYPGQEICQIYFEEPTGDTTLLYNGKYQNSEDVIPSRLFMDVINDRLCPKHDF